MPLLVVTEAKEGEVEGLKREADKEEDLGDRKKRKREEEKDANSNETIKTTVSINLESHLHIYLIIRH